MNWKLWSRQIDAIVRLEIKQFIYGKRFLGASCVLAYAPVVLFLFAAIFRPNPDQSLTRISNDYSTFFQIFVLRFSIFMCCGVLFSQLFRGAVLEKTLHFYLLAPIRRATLAVGKYIAGLVASIFIFGTSTVASFILIYSRNAEFSAFFSSGPGIAHLARYLVAVMLACTAYGALFVVVGLLFKNPGAPTMLLLGWESFNSFLPSVLQKISVVHYLQPLLPVAIDRGPFAVVTDPTPLYLGIPALLIATAAFLTVASLLLSHMEVTYSAD